MRKDIVEAIINSLRINCMTPIETSHFIKTNIETANAFKYHFCSLNRSEIKLSAVHDFLNKREKIGKMKRKKRKHVLQKYQTKSRSHVNFLSSIIYIIQNQTIHNE